MGYTLFTLLSTDNLSTYSLRSVLTPSTSTTHTMPAYRRRPGMCCASGCTCAEPSPKTRKPRKPRSLLTDKELADAAAKRAIREAKKEWEKTLVPWVGRYDFFWPEDTIVRAPHLPHRVLLTLLYHTALGNV